MEVRQAQSVNGPLAVLNDYYDVYVTQPDDAKWRLDNMHEVYLDDMHSKYVYPNVFMSIDDTNRVSQLDTDIKKYAEQKESGLDLKRRDRGRVGRVSPEDGRLRPCQNTSRSSRNISTAIRSPLRKMEAGSSEAAAEN